jgi:hypothetical protein
MIIRCITKTVSIDAPIERVFAYLANAQNWPQWAIVNVKAVNPRDDDWWDMTTPAGPAKLRIRANAEYGILDHDFETPDASWSVPARVVPNGTGSEFMITFFQPPHFTDAFFDDQVSFVDKELAKLKENLEQ